MTAAQIIEHAGYLRDTVKLTAYEAALQEVVGPDSCVLDLGAGSGILGLLAARAGAGKVYAVDSGSIIEVASSIAKASGYADRIVHVRERSDRLSLPQLADVIVCDQIGGLVYDAGVLKYFDDARRRLLAPGGVLVPSNFDLLAAPVDTEVWQQTVGIWSSRPAGFDLEPMAEFATNTEFRHELPAADFLADPAVWASITSDHMDKITGEAVTTVARPGHLNAIVGMFVAQLSPSVKLTNCPLLPDHFNRWQNVYPLPEQVAVAEGDVISIIFDIRPATYLTSWKVEIRRQNDADAPLRYRGATVLGRFLTPADIAMAGGSLVPKVSPLLVADQFILGRVDGSNDERAIVDEVWEHHGDAFRSRQDAEGRVHRLLHRHLKPEPTWHTAPTG